jgi:hypothetical protein
MDSRIFKEIAQKKRLASKIVNLEAQLLLEREQEAEEELYVKGQLGEPVTSCLPRSCCCRC